VDFFGWDFVKVTSILCLRREGIACRAKSEDFPCITKRDLCVKVINIYQETDLNTSVEPQIKFKL
jgi:hypothetical protein